MYTYTRASFSTIGAVIVNERTSDFLVGSARGEGILKRKRASWRHNRRARDVTNPEVMWTRLRRREEVELWELAAATQAGDGSKVQYEEKRW